MKQGKVRGRLGRPQRPCQALRALSAAVGGLLVGGALYVYSFHRVKTIAEVGAMLQTLSKPTHDDRCRRVNATHLQCLPNVFFIGASKCGTTSITEYLARQPGVHFVRRRIYPTDRHREVHRFDRNTYHRSIRAVELLEEWTSSPVVQSAEEAVIHYTPHYLYAPTVPFDLRDLFPPSLAQRLKFIVILRNPTRRALSSYWFQNSHIFHPRDQGSHEELSTLCESEFARRRTFDACMGRDRSDGSSTDSASVRKALRHRLELCFGSSLRSTSLGGLHVDKGVYADQLVRWFANFPRENFFITSLEQWQRDAVGEFSRLLRFIGVPPSTSALGLSLSANASLARLVRPNSLQTEAPRDLLQRLDSFFMPHTHRLGRLLSPAPLLD